PARHPMVLEDDAPAAAPARHPMVLEDDAPAAAAPAPMVVEDDVPVVLPEDEAPPAAAPRARPAPPPPAAARKTGSGGRPLPPPPPAAAIPKRPITLDQLSLPPPAARPPAPPRPPVRAATMELDSLPPPVAAPPPPPAAARKPPPAPKAAPDPSQGSAPLWARDQGSEASPTPARVAAQRRPPSGPLKPRWEPPADEAELFSRALEAAVELSVDPAAAPNETRFSNAPPSPALALSAAEVSPRRAAAADSDADALQPSADLLSRLPLFPLFAEVPPDALAEMIQGTDLLELQDGDYVMRRGDAADALYGIVEGSVAVNVPGSNFALTLAEGDVFGESCLLQDEPRHADVRVHGRLTVLRIPRDVLLQVLRQHPPLAELLPELLTRRLLANTLQSSPLFQEFDAEGRSTLSSLFEVRRAAEGTRLAVAGKRMDGLYISLTGTLLVEAPGQAPRVAAPGSMFGQHTLISQEPAPATITARVNLVVLRLPSATFSQLAMQYPTIVMRLAELSTDAVVSVNL
ncbi:MAG TPA: cyclic nucleotide-binding domain-containing protein, partial [Polyangiales bacterium]|nr:cyclic nucleotide-binding domain-containing protein [Polyangiales bacterium]